MLLMIAVYPTEGPVVSQTLKSVDIHIVDSESCSDAYYPQQITDNMLCAGEGREGSCYVSFCLFVCFSFCFLLFCLCFFNKLRWIKLVLLEGPRERAEPVYEAEPVFALRPGPSRWTRSNFLLICTCNFLCML